MALKILHVLDHSVPLHSGYSFRTLAILREQHRLGWQTLQVTTPKQGKTAVDEEIVDGFTFLRAGHGGQPGLLKQMMLTAKRLEEAIERFSPDIIHAHSPLLTALPALRVARRHRLPVVYEMRASWEDASVDHGTTAEGSFRYRLSKAAETVVLRKAHHVTTICEGLRKEILSRAVLDEKVTVIPNAVDIDRFSFHAGPRDDAKQKLGLASKPTLGFIGSFYSYEGLDDLLLAVAELSHRKVDVQVVLVGGGPSDELLRGMATKLGLEDRVQFVGRVGHDEVHLFYKATDLLVYARKQTRLTEMVTPLKPLEAMAQGNLVLASDVGGHRELIRDGETGFLFRAGDVQDLASAVENVLAADAQWERIRNNGLEFVKTERNWRKSVSGYFRAYRHALAAFGRVSDYEFEGDV